MVMNKYIHTGYQMLVVVTWWAWEQ